MKLWELVSAFRSEPSVLESVLSGHGFAEFGINYAMFDQLVNEQNRDILDAVVPNALVHAVACRCSQKFSLGADDVLRLADNANGGKILSALEVVKRFGGAVIEEVLEYGSSRVDGQH
ncbi:MAG: hypothetical protein NXI22_19010 [bacterium]|nr:hypothetical protein [bacterium]